jgi:RNA polymerase sigma-70 factor (ECF subfamily)
MSPSAPKEGEHVPPAMNPAAPPASGRRADSAPDEDLELVRRTQAGDRAAFRALFDKYNRRVFAIALGVVKVPQEAADVVQEVFVRVHKHIENFRGESSFHTWLHRITMNLSIDHHRKRKRAPRQVDYDDGIGRDGDTTEAPLGAVPVFFGADPGRNASSKELRTKLEGALSTLPEIHQQVLLLREVEGLSYEEIAETMQIPKGTVMSRLFHARRKMQTALAEYVDGDLKPQTEGDE